MVVLHDCALFYSHFTSAGLGAFNLIKRSQLEYSSKIFCFQFAVVFYQHDTVTALFLFDQQFNWINFYRKKMIFCLLSTIHQKTNRVQFVVLVFLSWHAIVHWKFCTKINWVLYFNVCRDISPFLNLFVAFEFAVKRRFTQRHRLNQYVTKLEGAKRAKNVFLW